MGIRRRAERRRVAGIAALTLATTAFVGMLAAEPADAAVRNAAEPCGGAGTSRDATGPGSPARPQSEPPPGPRNPAAPQPVPPTC